MMINKRLIGLVNDSKKYIKYTVIFNWFSLIANIISIFFIANLLEKVFNKNFSTNNIMITTVVVLIAIIIRIICNIFASKMSYYSSVNVKRVLREKIYNKLTKLGPSYTEKVSTSEVVQVSVEGIEQLDI
ncbi:MAG: ABC transporter transmembrane domain-containing protein, partial [Clostridium sp.]|nr:ABC transporter transmembrane domain-containing protein [Clostridium sp.]